MSGRQSARDIVGCPSTSSQIFIPRVWCNGKLPNTNTIPRRSSGNPVGDNIPSVPPRLQDANDKLANLLEQNFKRFSTCGELWNMSRSGAGHLQLRRAYAMRGALDKARFDCQDFLRLWKIIDRSVLLRRSLSAAFAGLPVQFRGRPARDQRDESRGRSRQGTIAPIDQA